MKVLIGDLAANLDFRKIRLLDFAMILERHCDDARACLIRGLVEPYLTGLSPEE